ncbi:MAG: preprotein translocase subunit SecG [Planctomycetes bacterium]|nr:preprotein translocase subunit SecG [Planctomycetota bacterium]
MSILAAASNTLLIILATLFVLNCVAMIVFVLFRQSDSGGIGAAFGGGDGGGAFGTKGQAVVDKVITFMGATFMVIALVFSLVSTGTKGADARGVSDDAGTESTQEGSK